jgi:hypothetical protein
MDNHILGSLVQLFSFPTSVDSRGSLLPLEFAELPFQPERAFVTRVSEAGTQRGGHAHKDCRQLLLSLAGEIDVELAHGGRTARVRLDALGRGMLIEPTVWSRLTFATADAQLLVLADRPYDPVGYIDDRGDPIAPALR